MGNLSIIECIMFHAGRADCSEMKYCNNVLAIYSDKEHTHFLLKGKLVLPPDLKHFIILSHSWRDLPWCLNRLNCQKDYHQKKSVQQEIEELLDYLEIPMSETMSLLQECKKYGSNYIAAGPQQSDHTVICRQM